MSLSGAAFAQLRPQINEVNVPVVTSTGSVSSPQVGSLIYDTSDNLFKGYNQASVWTPFEPSPWVASGSNLSYAAGFVGIGAAAVSNWGLAINKSSGGGQIYMKTAAGTSTQMAFTDVSHFLNYMGVENSSGGGIIGSGDPYAFVIGTGQPDSVRLFTNGVSRIIISGTGEVKSTGVFSSDLGVQVSTATTQPACDVAHRGTIWIVQGGTGVADVQQTCIKNASDVYVWQ